MMMLPEPSLPWPIPLEAVRLIAESEQGPTGGCALKAYQCPAGVWTIGWGETDAVKRGDRCTKEQADRWLCEDLVDRTKAILAVCKVPPSDNELGAMVSLSYNIGLGWEGSIKPAGAKNGFRQSTVLKAHNLGDHPAAGRAFALWNKARVNGQLTELRGLTVRRAAEAAHAVCSYGVGGGVWYIRVSVNARGGRRGRGRRPALAAAAPPARPMS